MAEKVRSEALRSTSDTTQNGSKPTVHLAVLGASGVGKSMFIQRALDLKQAPSARASAKRMSLDNVIYLVKLIEIDLTQIAFSSKGRLSWPQKVDGQPMPSVNGVLLLYDITNKTSVADFQNILGALMRSDTPCVLVSCKCDQPPRARQIEAGTVEELGRTVGGIDTYQTSSNVPETQKRCISILLRAILAKSIESPTTPVRTRSQSFNKAVAAETSPGKAKRLDSIDTRASSKSKGPSDKHDRNSRVLTDTENSEAESARSQPSTPRHKSSSKDVSHATGADSKTSARGPSSNVSPPTSNREEREPPGSPTSYLLDSALRPDSEDSHDHNTFLDMDDDDQSEIVADTMSISQQSTLDVANLKLSEKDQNKLGSSFDELVDRLLALPMTKAEGKFMPVFLCLYRKFASPSQLLSAILARFDRVEKSGEAQLTRIGEQLRFLQVLAQWTGEYPGDFAHSSIRSEIVAFVAKLEKSRIFNFAAKEISMHLDNVADDEDSGWAFHDPDAKDVKNESMKTASSTTLGSKFSKASTDDPLRDSQSGSKEDITEASSRTSAATSAGSSLARWPTGSTHSLATLMTYEEASREAETLNPVPRAPLTKMLWRQFMSYPGEEIARELTRIDWIMYSSIRPRDLVRHVSLPGDKRERSRSLENVNRMISHFNHVALFVSSMVLLRDKPKHRAMALEKFMHIAWKLRQMNNYNSLGSVIAGINGTAIHRLALTRELVPHTVQKDFMRLVILMGTGKSHFAYRLAWENSFSEKIPFLPLHRRDLVAAEDGNRTFVGPNGDRINWEKLDIMGDVIREIQRSQDRPYPSLQRNAEIQRLVLETRFLEGDEDTIDPYQELYERSVQVEPSGAADAQRRFGWLRGR